MWVQCLVLDIFLVLIAFVASETETNLAGNDDNINSHFPESSTDKSTISNTPISIEILRIYVPFEAGNSVKLIWGKQIDDYQSNLTYGIHYGFSEDDLKAPKLTTTNLSALIEDLKFCTKYMFAVTVIKDGNNEINPNNIRSIVTHIDSLEPPQNLQIDFMPAEQPALLMKWSASCPNIGRPIGYVIAVFEKSLSRYVFVRIPPSEQVDFIYNIKANYDEKFDIKVATDFPGSKTTDSVTYKVPSFLQPYKVKITSNPDGAFMIYWSEPFVPYYVGRYYYQVNIYAGDTISTDFERYYVTRPVLIYKGNGTEYTFIVGTVSYDGEHRSLFTNPIVANLNGETREIAEEK